METKKENHKPEPAELGPPTAPVKTKVDSSAEAMDAKREEIAKSEKNTKRLHAELDAMIGARRHEK